MTAAIGSIYGPRVRTRRPRIDFWYGIPAEASWESMWELVQQRQRWVRSHYGNAAFEDKPLMDGYSKFDLSDGGKSLNEFALLLNPRDAQKIEFLANQQQAEHDEHHFIRLRPFCPTCRDSEIFAKQSLASWLVRNPGRIPRDESDLDLGWDTEQVVEPQTSKQAELFMNMDQLSSMRTPHDLVEGIIPRRGVGYITGRDRSLKTFLALDILLHIAFMMPYWLSAGADAQARPRRKLNFAGEGKVIFAAGEGVSSFNPRIQAWIRGQHVKSYGDPNLKTEGGALALRMDGCKSCETEQDQFVGHVGHVDFVEPENLDNDEFVLRPGPGELEKRNLLIRRGTPNLFGGGEDYRYLLALARRERPDAIVLDTLALSSGAADQQSAVDMGLIHERAKQLEEASGGVVIIIAHTDKGDNDARGSSVIEDNADFVLHCNRVDNDQVEVQIAKRKDAEDNWKFHLGVSTIDLGLEQSSLILHDFDGELQGTPDPDLEEMDKVMKTAERIVMAKRHNLFDAYEFAFEFDGKVGAKTVRKLLDRAANEGTLVRIDGSKGRGNATRFHFPEKWMTDMKTLNVDIADFDEAP